MVKTTFEMDGLFTQEDIDNRFKVMQQCTKCNKWTLQNIDPNRINKTPNPCINKTNDIVCNSTAFNPKSSTSLRTFNPNKKKLTRKQEKEAGQ